LQEICYNLYQLSIDASINLDGEPAMHRACRDVEPQHKIYFDRLSTSGRLGNAKTASLSTMGQLFSIRWRRSLLWLPVTRDTRASVHIALTVAGYPDYLSLTCIG